MPILKGERIQPSKLQRLLSGQNEVLPAAPPPEDIMARIRSGDFNQTSASFHRLGPEELEALGIKLTPIPAMYDIMNPSSGEKLTVLAMDNAAFVMTPDHPMVQDLQGSMADVLIQNARAKQPILTAKGINDALLAAGLPVLKNRTPREILEFGAEIMEGYQIFLEAQTGVLRAQLKLQQLSAATDAMQVLREDIHKTGWEMAFTSSIRKQNATLMLRLAFLAAAGELVDEKTQGTLQTITEVDQGLRELKISAAKEWADGITELAGTSLGNLGKGVKTLADEIIVQGGGKITAEAAKILTEFTFGKGAYDEGLVKEVLEKLGIGADKLSHIAKRTGTSIGGLLRGFWDSIRGKSSQEDEVPDDFSAVDLVQPPQI